MQNWSGVQPGKKDDKKTEWLKLIGGKLLPQLIKTVQDSGGKVE